MRPLIDGKVTQMLPYVKLISRLPDPVSLQDIREYLRIPEDPFHGYRKRGQIYFSDSFGTIPYLLAYIWREPEKAI